MSYFVDAVRQWDGKFLSKIRARQRSTIGNTPLLIVFYGGKRNTRHSPFVCRGPRGKSINQQTGEVVRKKGTGAFAMCAWDEQPEWERAGALLADTQ